MVTYNASINKTLRSQQDLRNHREHCSITPERLAAIGRAVGHQVRIKRNSNEYGLYTVSEDRRERPDNIVRMGLAGRQRLGTSAEFNGVVDSQVPHPSLAEADAKTNSEFIERLSDDGQHTGLIAIAPHGGDIEPHTDQQAEHVASRLAPKAVSSWRCKGWKRGGGAFDRWHITSIDISEVSFPLLASVFSRGFTYAVAFHGFNRSEILIGGTAPTALKKEIRTAIQGATAGSGIQVCIFGQPGCPRVQNYNGDDPQNIVNRLSAGGADGIQIEQSLQARSNHWLAIAGAVADVYGPKL